MDGSGDGAEEQRRERWVVEILAVREKGPAGLGNTAARDSYAWKIKKNAAWGVRRMGVCLGKREDTGAE
jgi:hypothetical protein